MLKILVTLFLFLPATTLFANCSEISTINSIYQTILQSTASDYSIRKAQQLLQVNADGIWGRRSQTAYEEMVRRCNSYSYPNGKDLVEDAEIKDFYKEITVFESVPYKVCSNEQQPIFGEVAADPDPGAVVGGALVGGIIGKVVTETEGGAAIGAIIGGALANENQKSKKKAAITGFENKHVCSIKHKKTPQIERRYSFSTITFFLDGKKYSVQFQKN